MQKVCTIIIHSDVRAHVAGLSGLDLKSLSLKHSESVPGSFFHPLVKLGRWDGRIRALETTGSTFTLYLEHLLPDIIQKGYKIKIDDRRISTPVFPELIDENVYSHVIHSVTQKPTVLRDYQVRVVNKMLEAGTGVTIAATGAGKTIICTALVDSYGKKGLRTLTIVPDQTLIRQTKADYITYGLDVGEYSGKKKDLEHTHVVSTWQALQNNPTIVRAFQVVLVDECHQSKAAKLQSLLLEAGQNIPHRFGVTGTLPKPATDQLLIKAVIGTVLDEIPAHELIDKGVLSKLKIDCAVLEEEVRVEYDAYVASVSGTGLPVQSYKEFKANFSQDYSSEKTFIHRRKGRLEWIAESIMSLRDARGNTMVFVDSIAYARRIADLIPGAILVNGTDTKKLDDRLEIYERFKTENDLVVIATVKIAGTGLSINRIFNLVLLDLGKSFIRVIQAIGRALRTSPDKDEAWILDVSTDLKHGKKHLAERIAFYKEARYPYAKRVVKYNGQRNYTEIDEDTFFDLDTDEEYD